MKDSKISQSEILHKGLLKLAEEAKGSKGVYQKDTKGNYHNQNFCVVCGGPTHGAAGLCSFSCQSEYFGV
jgi:hypothetical protein